MRVQSCGSTSSTPCFAFYVDCRHTPSPSNIPCLPRRRAPYFPRTRFKALSTYADWLAGVGDLCALFFRAQSPTTPSLLTFVVFLFAFYFPHNVHLSHRAVASDDVALFPSRPVPSPTSPEDPFPKIDFSSWDRLFLLSGLDVRSHSFR